MKGTSSSFHLCFSCSSDQSLNFASKLSIAVVHRIPCKRRLCLWYGIFAESDLAYWAFCSLRPLSISSSCSRSHKHNLRGTLRANISRHWSCVSLTLVTLRTSAFCKPRRFIMAVNLSERIRKISKSVKLMRINERFLEPSVRGSPAATHPSASTSPQKKLISFHSSSSNVSTFAISVENSLEDGKPRLLYSL